MGIDMILRKEFVNGDILTLEGELNTTPSSLLYPNTYRIFVYIDKEDGISRWEICSYYDLNVAQLVLEKHISAIH